MQSLSLTQRQHILTHGHKLAPHIVRQYDIRGVVDQDWSVIDAYAIGAGLATSLREALNKPAGAEAPRMYVSRDGRLSSPSMMSALVQGILDCGVDVIEMPVGPTTQLYYAAYNRPCDAAVMITGSHNPPEFNGVKTVWQRQPFFGQQIQRLAQRLAAGSLLAGQGRLMQESVTADYLAHLLRTVPVPNNKPQRIVWDPGHGSMAAILSQFVDQLHGDHMIINNHVDGTFPAHHPDPTIPSNMEQLREAVLKEKAQLGIGFDGDGDRIGVIDHTGELIGGDQLMVVLAEEWLKGCANEPVVLDVKASMAVLQGIESLGLRPMMSACGHSLMKQKMYEVKARLAGEVSGHIFFGQPFYGVDDALLAALILMQWLQTQPKSLHARIAELPRTLSTPETRIFCADDRKFGIVEAITEQVHRDYPGQVLTTDGVRITTESGWWGLRASNTQPALSIRAEAISAKHLQQHWQVLQKYLIQHGVILPSYEPGAARAASH